MCTRSLWQNKLNVVIGRALPYLDVHLDVHLAGFSWTTTPGRGAPGAHHAAREDDEQRVRRLGPVLADKRYFFELTNGPKVIWADLPKMNLSPGAQVMFLDPHDATLSGNVTGEFRDGTESPFSGPCSPPHRNDGGRSPRLTAPRARADRHEATNQGGRV